MPGLLARVAFILKDGPVSPSSCDAEDGQARGQHKIMLAADLFDARIPDMAGADRETRMTEMG